MRETLTRISLILFWRVGQLWYGLTQRFHRRRDHPVPLISNIGDLLQRLSFGHAYKPDPWNGKLDVLRNPRIVQKWIDEGKKIGDCDEHAGYICNALFRAGRAGIAEEVWFCTILMTKLATGVVTGHAFVVFYPPEHGSLPEWMDYDWPKQCATERLLMADVAREYNARPIGMTMLRVTNVRSDDSLDFDYRDAKLLLAKKR